MNSNQDSDHGRPTTGGEVYQDTSRYSLDVGAVTQRFREAGFPFSERSASRWCQRGRLDCILLPVEGGRIEKYFATPESVETEIDRMGRFENLAVASHDRTEQDMARHDAPRQDTASQERDEFEERIKALEQEKMHLTIDNKVKEGIVNQLTEERKEMLGQLTEQSRMIGRLEIEVRALQAPTPGGGDNSGTEAASGGIQ